MPPVAATMIDSSRAFTRESDVPVSVARVMFLVEASVLFVIVLMETDPAMP